MEIKNDLEMPFNYSWDLVKLLSIVIIAIIIILIFYKYFEKIIDKVRNKISLPYIKAWYIKKLQILLNNISKDKISIRDSYLQLSNIIREFIERVTGINVLTLSKKEIQNMKINNLSLLMEEYYPPEFSKNLKGDIITSINKTMEVIRKWN